MRNDRYWKYGCFGIALLLFAGCVHLARLDALLRRCCRKALYHDRLGTYGLYLLFIIMGAFVLFAVWQWIAGKPPHRRMIAASLAAVCLYALLAHGYLSYHQDVYSHASRSEQKRYDKRYDKGLLYDLKGLFR